MKPRSGISFWGARLRSAGRSCFPLSAFRLLPSAWLLAGLAAAWLTPALAQQTVVVRPKEIDDVLLNPGIGFMTFQRFNGDKLNQGPGWTEGLPIVYQDFSGNLENKNHPPTTIAYFRIYWKFIEPEQGKYDWELIDKALRTARERRQTMMLRVAPHGRTEADAAGYPNVEGVAADVPPWFRAMVPWKKQPVAKWLVDPEDPLYLKHFGKLVRAVGARYDGHPGLEAVDISIVGSWGEGAGSELLTRTTREALMDAYLDSFRKTPLLIQLTDEKTVGYALSRANVGWRLDCLGNMGLRSPEWSHMNDSYPQSIIRFGLQDAWRKAPVSMEVCGVMQDWKDKGFDIDYIINQSLKWHISSFDAKSSAVPEEWRPQVDRWLRKMGYRFALRRFEYPAVVRPNDKLAFTSWWENKGVAPCYKQFPVALRLKGENKTAVLLTDADVRSWLPGDSLFDSAVFVPPDMSPGEYEVDIGLLDPLTNMPAVKLAIAGMEPDGWYHLGRITVKGR